MELIDGKLEAGLEDGLIAGGVGTTGPGVGGGGLTGLEGLGLLGGDLCGDVEFAFSGGHC